MTKRKNTKQVDSSQIRKRRKSKKASYVMFGYCKNDIDKVGYFSNDLNITEDVNKAKVFISKNIEGVKGFGTPEQWLEFINTDSSLNHGYYFHLV